MNSQEVMTAAERMGRVEVEHGKTDCKMPPAIAFTGRTWTLEAAKQKG